MHLKESYIKQKTFSQKDPIIIKGEYNKIF
jgi:hypothetical protein